MDWLTVPVVAWRCPFYKTSIPSAGLPNKLSVSTLPSTSTRKRLGHSSHWSASRFRWHCKGASENLGRSMWEIRLLKKSGLPPVSDPLWCMFVVGSKVCELPSGYCIMQKFCTKKFLVKGRMLPRPEADQRPPCWAILGACLRWSKQQFVASGSRPPM